MKSITSIAAVIVLTACAAPFPKVETPGLTTPKISMLFNFPEGSVCRVETSAGTLEMATIPGAIDFPQADRTAPSSCDLPDGRTVAITAHNFVPENNRVAGITVYPDGRAYITSSTEDGDLINLEPVDTVN